MYISLIILLNSIVIFTILIINRKQKIQLRAKDYILLVLTGGLAAMFAGFANTLGQDLLLYLFRKFIILENGEIYWIKGIYVIIFNFIYYFFIVGIVEEFSKNIIPLILCKNKEYRSKTSLECILNFMIVACVFSCIEDYIYIKNGAPGEIRLLTVLSGHLLYSLIFCKNFMNYKVRDKALAIGALVKHKTWKTEGNESLKKFESKFSNKNFLKKSFLFAILCHGGYNFTIFIFDNSKSLLFIFIMLLNALFIVLFILELIKIRNLEQEGINLFIKEYPYYNKEKLIELEIINE